MTIRALNDNWDWEMSYKSGKDEVLQNIKSRLYSWKNDCFFDLEAGVGWDNIMNGFNANENYVKNQIYTCISNTKGVQDVKEYY